MAELSAGSAEVMRSKVKELRLVGALPNHVPNHVFGQSSAPRGSVTADCSEDSARCDFGGRRPAIHSGFHPSRHRHSPDVAVAEWKACGGDRRQSGPGTCHGQGTRRQRRERDRDEPRPVEPKGGSGVGASVIAGDATDATLMNALVRDEAPDVLILNAGTRLPIKPIDQQGW